MSSHLNNNNPNILNTLNTHIPVEDLIVKPHCQDWAEAIHTIAFHNNEQLTESLEETRCRIKRTLDAYKYANAF